MYEDKIEELKKELQTMREVAVHNKKLLFEAVNKIIRLEAETSDGGKMIIKNSSCYQDIVSILIANGYFVAIHIDDNNNDILTIEFWRV